MTALSTAGLPVQYFVQTDANGVILSTVQSNCPQAGMTSVAAAVFTAVHGHEGAKTYLAGVVADYTTPAAAPAVPIAVARLQGRLQLSRAGLLAKAEAAVAATGGETAIWYADAQMWLRADPHVAVIAGALGLASADVDKLFTAAAAI